MLKKVSDLVAKQDPSRVLTELVDANGHYLLSVVAFVEDDADTDAFKSRYTREY